MIRTWQLEIKCGEEKAHQTLQGFPVFLTQICCPLFFPRLSAEYLRLEEFIKQSFIASRRDEQQHTHTATPLITDSKHSSTSNAVAPVGIQARLVSRSPGNNNQPQKCHLNVGKSHADPWLWQQQCDFRDTYLTWMLWVASCLRCWCWSKGRVAGAGAWQSDCTNNIAQAAGCQCLKVYLIPVFISKKTHIERAPFCPKH